MLERGGSAGLLREGKKTTWEGGMRVPAIFRQPGVIEPGVVSEIGSTLDILPTVAGFVGAEPPSDRAMDGYDLRGVLTGAGASPREEMFFYRRQELYAARKGAFKAHFITENAYGDDRERREHDPPLLFHLEIDPSEKYDVAERYPDALKEIQAMVEEHRAGVEIVESQLAAWSDDSAARDPDRPWKDPNEN